MLKSLQKRADILKRDAHTLQELITSVEESFANYNSETLKCCFGILYSCYKEILRLKGDNKYFTPHEQIRIKCANDLPINNVDITYAKYSELNNLVTNYFLRNQ